LNENDKLGVACAQDGQCDDLFKQAFMMAVTIGDVREKAENLAKSAQDVLLSIEAALRRSNLRLDSVRRYRKAGVHTLISEK
jgi:hypothetical protein